MSLEVERVMQVKARIYDTVQEKFGVISTLDESSVLVDFGTTQSPDIVEYDFEEFAEKVEADIIVGKYRTSLNSSDRVTLKPRSEQPLAKTNTVAASKPPTSHISIDFGLPQISEDVLLPLPQIIGYIDEKGLKFSPVPKKGYVQIEYRIVKQKVSLELTSEQIAKLKEMGIL